MTLGDLPSTFVKGFHVEDDVRKMKYSPLGETGMTVSAVSLGASSFGAGVSDDICVEIVHHALKAGVNYIDTAPWFGQGKSEEILGRALKGVPRNAYFLATKVGRYQTEVDKMFNFTSEKTTQSVEESLRRLGVKYLDVVQLHDVEFCASNQQIIKHTIPALLKLKKMGKIRHIGVTGYPIDILKDLVKQTESGTLSIVLNYCRATLFDQDLVQECSFFREHGIGVIHASPVAMGLLTNRGPAVWHPAQGRLREACQFAALLCSQKGVDLPKLALHFSLWQPGIASTLISAASLDYLQFNIDAVNTKLTDDEEKVMDEIQEKYFKPLKSAERNWLKIEVVRYWTSLNERGVEQPMDS